MASKSKIELSFADYLSSSLDSQTGYSLIEALDSLNLKQEAQSLQLYFENGADFTMGQGNELWGGLRCHVGKQLPRSTSIGEIWFDIVELTPMIYVANPEYIDHGHWVSMHPVYTWQFRTFLALVDWEVVQNSFLKVSDLMDPNRFNIFSSDSFIRETYHEEAVAYAHWFGKNLCGQFALEISRDCLKKDEFFKILPPDMKTWEEAEYFGSEFVRIAISQSTLDNDPDEVFKIYNSVLNSTTPEMAMFFGEWERMPEIGLCTAVAPQIGLLESLPRQAYEFIKLNNGALRPT